MRIWFSGDDKGVYWAECWQTGERTGLLKLIRLSDGLVVREKLVLLAFSAVFGPDVADIRDWNLMCTSWSEELDRTEGKERNS